VGLAVTHYALVRATHLWLANNDVGWFLHAGAVWLDGGTIGIDVIDTNPPLVIWLSGLEVELARWLALRPFVVHAVVTCALVIGSALLGGSGLLRSGLPAIAVALFRPFVIASSVFVAEYEFAQRDHWIAVLLMPYVAWAFARDERGTGVRALRLVVGACAGVAICLKPHYAGALLVVELLRLLRSRSLRSLLHVEAVIVAAVALLYLVSLPLLTPLYIDDLRATVGVYYAYDNVIPWWGPHTLWLVAALVAATAAWPISRSPMVPFALASVAISGWIAALVQHKNFAYHYIPADWFAQATLASLLGIALARGLERRPALAAGVGMVLALVLCVAIEGLLLWPTGFDGRDEQRALLDRYAAGESVLVISTGAHRLFPAINFSKARSVSPYSCLWQIPGNYTPAERAAAHFRYRSWEEMAPIERRLVARVVEVMARERPRLLGFDVAPAKQGFGRTAFEFRPYFSAHPSFVDLMRSYDRVAVEGGFEYYRRRGE
jgi:hypothetical protein